MARQDLRERRHGLGELSVDTTIDLWTRGTVWSTLVVGISHETSAGLGFAGTWLKCARTAQRQSVWRSGLGLAGSVTWKLGVCGSKAQSQLATASSCRAHVWPSVLQVRSQTQLLWSKLLVRQFGRLSTGLQRVENLKCLHSVDARYQEPLNGQLSFGE